MKKIAAFVAFTLSLLPSIAAAQERAGDAALGAISGAVVLGPIGAVAGALVGYTAGPSIAHSWGVRRSHPAHQARQTARPEARASDAQLAQRSQPEAPKRPSESPSRSASSAAPPVQGLE